MDLALAHDDVFKCLKIYNYACKSSFVKEDFLFSYKILGKISSFHSMNDQTKNLYKVLFYMAQVKKNEPTSRF